MCDRICLIKHFIIINAKKDAYWHPFVDKNCLIYRIHHNLLISYCSSYIVATALNQDSKLHPDTIHKWLFLNGMGFAEKVDKFKTLIITSNDVIDGKLITDWTQLHQS